MGEWVVFDYGGVLCRDQSAADRAALVDACGAVDGERFWAAYWELRPPYDRGELAPTDYWRRVTGRDVGAALDTIEAIDVASWSHPYEQTLDVVRALAAAGTKLALLSNCPEPMAAVIDTLSWAELILDRFYSCRLGVTKPDPASYHAVLDGIGARPEQTTFVDDRPANIAGAAAVGMRALLFTDPATLADALQGDA